MPSDNEILQFALLHIVKVSRISTTDDSRNLIRKLGPSEARLQCVCGTHTHTNGGAEEFNESRPSYFYPIFFFFLHPGKSEVDVTLPPPL